MSNALARATRCIAGRAARRMGALGIALLAVTGAAQAGLIVVAGDTTPVFSLTDSFPNPASAGNQQFFSNVLGAGSSVVVQATASNPFAASEIDEFYDGLAGVASTVLPAAAEVTAEDLSGTDLFVAALPDAFSVAEIAALRGFVRSGGSVFLMGEGTLTSSSAAINALLHGLGSGMSLGTLDVDDGPRIASGGQIVSGSLTSGVASFNYGATLLVSGGSPVFLASDQQPFVAVGTATVAEPATLSMLALAFGIIAFHRARPAAGTTRMA